MEKDDLINFSCILLSDMMNVDISVAQAGYNLKFKGLGVMNCLTVSSVTCLRRS